MPNKFRTLYVVYDFVVDKRELVTYVDDNLSITSQIYTCKPVNHKIFYAIYFTEPHIHDTILFIFSTTSGKHSSTING